MMHATYNKNKTLIQELDIQVNLLHCPCMFYADMFLSRLHLYLCHICESIFSKVCHRRVQASVCSKNPRLHVHPTVICTCLPTSQLVWGSDVIDWMITLPLTSIRSSPAVKQRLTSPC